MNCALISLFLSRGLISRAIVNVRRAILGQLGREREQQSTGCDKCIFVDFVAPERCRLLVASRDLWTWCVLVDLDTLSDCYEMVALARNVLRACPSRGDSSQSPRISSAPGRAGSGNEQWRMSTFHLLMRFPSTTTALTEWCLAPDRNSPRRGDDVSHLY